MTAVPLFETVTTVLEIAGVVAICLGFALSVVLALRRWVVGRDGRGAFATLRRSLGGSILLGLEILVAADLVRTVTSKPSIEDAVILAIIVGIRTVLSLSIQIEIDGVLPWRRALLTSGATVLAREVSAQRRSGTDDTDPGA